MNTYDEEARSLRGVLSRGVAAEIRVSHINPNVPTIARVYDYWLGGKDNFAVDRELAERFVQADPMVIDGVRSNRAFLRRAVAEGAAAMNEALTLPVTFRRHEQVTAFFNGLELAEPGVVATTQWRPEPGADTKPLPGWVGVARKPSTGVDTGG
jgi:hypothetical protein